MKYLNGLDASKQTGLVASSLIHGQAPNKSENQSCIAKCTGTPRKCSCLVQEERK